MRVLIVDDHLDLVSNVFAYLERRNFVLDAARDGESAVELGRNGQYDVLVLDWMLPQLDGLQVLQRLRSADVDTPVLMLSARGDIPDKLSGFAAGADDYLTKPFSIAELEARIVALHTRRIGRAKVLQVGPLRYHLASQQITRDGCAIQLHSGPRKLLQLLMKESPNVVSKDRLESLLWGEDRPDKDLLRTHIYELRRSIDAGYPTKLLQTVPRIGYRIVEPDPGR
ncbi:MAG: response regulator transcription factor [Sinobacteraceae bacterium]|nr:response regulator transcription factor [Nevskiaceae bacterium]